MTARDDQTTRTDARSLAVQVARYYYVDGWKKVAIAEKLGLSRFKVSRLIDYARESGLVRIEIREDNSIDLELSESVRQRLGIERALVLDAASSAPAGVSGVAADYLRRTVNVDATVGLAWSRSTRALVDNLPPLQPCTIAQLCGVVPQPAGEEHNVELVRSAARNAHAKAVTFYAPLVVPDPKTASILRKQPGIREALAVCDHLATAVVAIGMWAPGESTVYDSLPPEQSALFASRGAIAETCGILLNEEGEPIPDGLQDRTIAVTFDQLHRAADVVTITTDAQRIDALQAMARSGLVSTVITSSLVAHRLLR